jgi:hypothetical protein
MQFNHPEILALLFVLIIPILIHLFQLQRFKKEAFTNVKFLSQIERESRKSSRIKKLLILLTRLLALTCLILAFAQPEIKESDEGETRKTVIYVDNSLSMQAKDNNGSELLQNTKRLLIDQVENFSGEFALITNNDVQEELKSEAFRQELTKVPYHPTRKDIYQVILEAGTLASNEKFDGADVFLFSDFRYSTYEIDSLPSGDRNRYFLIPVRSENYQNLSLDSLWMSTFDRNQVKINARLLAQNMDQDNLSVSLVLNGQLFGKTSVPLENDNFSTVEFSIPPETVGSGAMIFTDPRLGFDNSMFFTLPEPIKPKVLVIGKASNYLTRIYTDDSFDLSFNELSNLNQGTINEYDLILLNELEEIPVPLVRSLKSFVQQIGNLVIIPSAQPNMASYQSMFRSLDIGSVSSEFEREKIINSVFYEHPFFNNVFKGEVRNFDFPEATYGIETVLRSSSSLIDFDDGSSFASQIPSGENSIYWIASPLSGEFSNFRDSPLIVPLFYNFSLPENRAEGVYSIIGRNNELIIRNDSLSGNALKITNGKEQYIPLQKNTSRNVTMSTKDYPLLPGVYQITDQDRVVSEHAFNYDRNLIRQEQADLTALAGTSERIKLLANPNEGLRELNDLFRSQSLWQLFTIFALIFLVLEMLIQKFFKN